MKMKKEFEHRLAKK